MSADAFQNWSPGSEMCLRHYHWAPGIPDRQWNCSFDDIVVPASNLVSRRSEFSLSVGIVFCWIVHMSPESQSSGNRPSPQTLNQRSLTLWWMILFRRRRLCGLVSTDLPGLRFPSLGLRIVPTSIVLWRRWECRCWFWTPICRVVFHIVDVQSNTVGYFWRVPANKDDANDVA